MKIKWEKVNELSDGHGILFIHKAIDKSVAFLVGYEWLHGAPYQVTVEIIKKNHLSKEHSTLDINKIIDETKNTIQLFIKNKGLKDNRSSEDQVRVWWNA